MSHYVYFLFSNSSNKYYVGISHDVSKRLEYHNEKSQNSYTSKYRPWSLRAIIEVNSETSAIRLERYIKKRKSKTFIQNCIVNSTNPEFIFNLFKLANIED